MNAIVPRSITSVAGFGLITFLIALIPGYAQIGIAAPILAVAARMVQGFSLGGEVGPTTAYLLEAAPAHRRGLAVSWQGASQGLSAAVGGAAGFNLAEVRISTAGEVATNYINARLAQARLGDRAPDPAPAVGSQDLDLDVPCGADPKAGRQPA